MTPENLKHKKVLVTGGSGFIPSHLVKKLHTLGADVAILTKYNSLIDNVRLVGLWEHITPIEADLRNLDSLLKLQDFKPDYVFHMAAYNHVGDSFTHVQEALMANAIGTANLIEAYHDFERFVYVSSSEIYGHQDGAPFQEDMTPFPISPYAIGKYAGELYAQMKHHVNNYPITLVRPFNAFGPYQSPKAIIAEIIIKCLRGEPIKATEGKQTRDFNFVGNLIDGILLAATNHKCIGYPINLGSGRDISIRDLIEMIHALTSSASELQIGALDYRPTEIWKMQANAQKAHDILGWTPRISLEEGLKTTINWYRKFNALFYQDNSPLGQL
jgi:UDP-glucose 4-epimerase